MCGSFECIAILELEIRVVRGLGFVVECLSSMSELCSGCLPASTHVLFL